MDNPAQSPAAKSPAHAPAPEGGHCKTTPTGTPSQHAHALLPSSWNPRSAEQGTRPLTCMVFGPQVTNIPRACSEGSLHKGRGRAGRRGSSGPESHAAVLASRPRLRV